MRIILAQIFFATFFLLMYSGVAQNDSTLSVAQIEQYSLQSKQLVSYLEGTLNFLGNPNELPSDKDIIFNQSYLKMFANDEVQVEDDLDENREIPLNKDIQAYLKDIDFFFKEVKFHFDIEKVEHLVTDSNIIVFKLTLDRQLEGVTIENDTIVNNQLRYIELNLDPLQKDLKIASIYTTKVRQKEELRHWWNNMPTEWKNHFGKSVIVYDTLPFKNILWFSDSSLVTMKWINDVSIDTAEIIDDGITDPPLWANDSIIVVYDTISRVIRDTIKVNTGTIYSLLKTFRKIPIIDISNDLTIKDLSPLDELTELVELNISNTLIEDLKPIRNLKKLEGFNCSGSTVTSLLPMRYIISLKELDISNTMIDNIDVVSNFKELSKLYMSKTNVLDLAAVSVLQKITHLEASKTDISDLTPLTSLTLLSDLNISNTKITSISNIDSIISLQHLNIDTTNIESIVPLSGCSNLSVLQANSTYVSDLTSLRNLSKLKVIYCDNSKVGMREANKFMDENPTCLVIYNSQELVNWWEDLSEEWRNIFKSSFDLKPPITKEKLHILINQTSLSVAHNRNIVDIIPLKMLHRLEILKLQNTAIMDLTPLSGLNNLEELNLNNTEITTLEPILSLHNLTEIKIENTKIVDLNPLSSSGKLEIIYCDKSGVVDEMALAFRKKNPDCLIVFQSEKLRMWWNGLNSVWQTELQKTKELPAVPSNEQLQKLVNISKLQITDNTSLNNLNPLHIFTRLEELTINRTSITDISPILSLTTLKKLDIAKNPIAEIGSISKLIALEELIIRNTSIEDMEPVEGLRMLKTLDIGGTKIKSLKSIQGLSKLQRLYINNTRIKNIKPLYSLNNLEFLQCYNTSIKSSRIQEYQQQNPKVEVVFY